MVVRRLMPTEAQDARRLGPLDEGMPLHYAGSKQARKQAEFSEPAGFGPVGFRGGQVRGVGSD